jgi:hypothetical protein
MILHLPLFRNICHLLHQFTNSFKSNCIVSVHDDRLANISVSSAFSLTLLMRLSLKSFIKIKNNSGPSTEPCGTPLKTSSQDDTLSPSTSRCLRSDRKDCINFNSDPEYLIPYAFSFVMSFL